MDLDVATVRSPRAELSVLGAVEDGNDFHGFVVARSAVLFRGALVLTGNREAAEDLVQETLERVWRKWRTIAVKDAPDAYVRRIMVNLANDRWRRFRRTVPHQDDGRTAPGDDYGQADARDQLSPGTVRSQLARGIDKLRGQSSALSGPSTKLPTEGNTMMPHGSRPSVGRGYSPSEQELVNAMNDFVSSSEAPRFDASVIARGARRKRATAIAGISAALVVLGGGTALAAGSAGGSHAARPAAVSHATTTTTYESATTVLYQNGGTTPIELGGLNPIGAKALLDKAQITPEFGKASEPGCKPGSVIAVSPHAPTVVHRGATVKVTVCTG